MENNEKLEKINHDLLVNMPKKDLEAVEVSGAVPVVASSGLTKMIIDIAILYPGDNMCGTANQLILDSITTTYKLKDPASKKQGDTYTGPTLNGKSFPITLGVDGVLRSINAVNSDKLLEFQIKVGTVENPMSYCEDTPYGFKLSNIMYNLGEINLLEPNKTNNITIHKTDGWKDIAHLVFVQRAFIVNRCNQNYVIFSFVLKNVGTSKARKLLFKDVIPEGLNFMSDPIYTKSLRGGFHKIPSNKYQVSGRKILAALSDIDTDEELTVILCCTLSNCMCVCGTNVGCVAYLGFQAFGTVKDNPTMSRSLILTQLSNIKKVNKL